MTSIALKAPEAWLSIKVSELPQYGCPLMKKALPDVNLAQLLITETNAVGAARVKSHGVPFLASGRPRANAHARFRWQRRRVYKRPARLGVKAVDPLGSVGPGHFTKRLAVQEFAVFPVQAIEIAVAVSLNESFGRLAGQVDVDQHRLVDAVIVPEVVWAVLKMPFI